MVRKKVKEKILTTQVGSSWANLLQDIGYLYNVPDITYDTIEEMLKDETVQAALKFHVLNILNYLGSYSHDDEVIENLVNRAFENLDTTLELAMEKLLFYEKAYGFAVGELVWEVVGNELLLKKIVPLPPSTLQFKMENGEIVGVVQMVPGKTVEMPMEKVIVLREGQKPYGESLFQYLYRPWKFKSVLFKFWAIAMERYASPVLVGKTADPAALDSLLEELQSLWSNGIIALTADEEVTTLEAKNSVAEPFEQAIEYANMLIYRGLLLPQLLASTRNVGSYALGEVHLKLFMSSLRREARKLSSELIDQVVARIIEYNVGVVEDYGRFLEQEEPSTDERAKLAQALTYLVQAGFLDPVRDSEWVRELLRFPNPEPEEEELGDEDIWSVLERSKKRWIEQNVGP